MRAETRDQPGEEPGDGRQVGPKGRRVGGHDERLVVVRVAVAELAHHLEPGAVTSQLELDLSPCLGVEEPVDLLHR